MINIKFFREQTLHTRVKIDDLCEHPTYGMLIKHYKDYQFFKDIAADMRYRESVQSSNVWNIIKDHHWSAIGSKLATNDDSWNLYLDKTAILFSVHHQYFWITVKSITITIAFLFIVGAIVEFKRKKFKLWKMFEREELNE